MAGLLLTSATLSGVREEIIRVLAPPLNLPRWRDALRKKLRECSGPDSCKSGDRLPEGAGVLSICHEGDSAKIVFLR